MTSKRKRMTKKMTEKNMQSIHRTDFKLINNSRKIPSKGKPSLNGRQDNSIKMKLTLLNKGSWFHFK